MNKKKKSLVVYAQKPYFNMLEDLEEPFSAWLRVFKVPFKDKQNIVKITIEKLQ